MATASEEVIDRREEGESGNSAQSQAMTARKALLDAFGQEQSVCLKRHQQAMDEIGQRHGGERAALLQDLAQDHERWSQENAKLSDRARESAWALEMAKRTEALVRQQEAEAQSQLANADLPDWREFLQARSKSGDVTARELLEEMAEQVAQGQGSGLEGPELVPPKPVVLDGLTSKVEKDGSAVHYLRANQEVFTDRGKRIDVVYTRDQEVEAALRLAAAKFKPGTPLKLTGDDEFKDRAARIAGELGIPIRNRDLQQSWADGQAKAAQNRSLAVETPDITLRNGIGVSDDKSAQVDQSPVSASPEVPSDLVTSPEMREPDTVRIQTSPAGLTLAGKAGIPVDDQEILMPRSRYLAARSNLAHTEAAARMELSHLTLTESLSGARRTALMDAGLADENGLLTHDAIDMILVHDLVLQEAREQMPEAAASLLRDPEGEAERVTQQDRQEEQDSQQALRTRNIDESLETEKNQEHLEQEVLEGAELAAAIVLTGEVDWAVDLADDTDRTEVPSHTAQHDQDQDHEVPDFEVAD